MSLTRRDRTPPRTRLSRKRLSHGGRIGDTGRSGFAATSIGSTTPPTITTTASRWSIERRPARSPLLADQRLSVATTNSSSVQRRRESTARPTSIHTTSRGTWRRPGPGPLILRSRTSSRWATPCRLRTLDAEKSARRNTTVIRRSYSDDGGSCAVARNASCATRTNTQRCRLCSVCP